VCVRVCVQVCVCVCVSVCGVKGTDRAHVEGHIQTDGGHLVCVCASVCASVCV